MQPSPISLIASLFFLSSCYNIDKSELQQRPIVIGHGGSGFTTIFNHIPMNSMESLHHAISKYHADGVEMDVQLSSDNRLIVFHDKMMEESTNCNGHVNGQTEDQLIECVYSCLICKLLKREYYVTSLENVFKRFSEFNDPPLLTLDLKLYPAFSDDNEAYRLRFAESLMALIDKSNFRDNIMIESASKEMLLNLQSINPELKLFIYPADFETGFAIAKDLGLFGITMRHDRITSEQVKNAHQNGLKINIWGTRTKKANKEAVLKKPDFIQTDHIKSLKSILD